MNIIIYENSDQKIAEYERGSRRVCDTQDALDVMADANTRGATSQILYKEDIDPAFFDLKTGLAGEILQKYSNYRNRLAIIGDFSRYKSRALKDFIYESNRGGTVFFMPDLESALEKFHKA